MGSMILECPHCGAEKIGFAISAQLLSANLPPEHLIYKCLMLCSGCEEAVVGTFRRHNAGLQPNSSSPMACSTDPRGYGWVLEKMYPTPEPSKCPMHTPPEIERIFLQASKALKRGDPDASGAMSRKVVDVSTQRLLGDDSTKFRNIQDRIDALADKGALTSDLKDWAHQVRLGGNDAAHDLDPYTPEEAADLLDFAELYLTYVYMLPSRLKERRQRAEREKTAAKTC